MFLKIILTWKIKSAIYLITICIMYKTHISRKRPQQFWQNNALPVIVSSA